MITKTPSHETISLDGKAPELPTDRLIDSSETCPPLAGTNKEARNVRRAVDEVRKATDDLEAAKSLIVLYLRGTSSGDKEMLTVCKSFDFSQETIRNAEAQLGIERNDTHRWRLPLDFGLPSKLREVIRCTKQQILDVEYEISRPKKPKPPVAPRDRVLKLLGKRNGLRDQELKVPSGLLAELEAEGLIRNQRKRATNFWFLARNLPTQSTPSKRKKKKVKVQSVPTTPEPTPEPEPFTLALESLSQPNERGLLAIAFDADEGRISAEAAKSALEGYLFVEEFAAEHERDGGDLIVQLLNGLHRAAFILRVEDDYLISPRGYARLRENPLQVPEEVMEYVEFPTTDESNLSSMIAESRHLREMQDLCRVAIEDLNGSSPHKKLMQKNSRRIAVLRGLINALKPKVLVEA